jgi:hypothetical protein
MSNMKEIVKKPVSRLRARRTARRVNDRLPLSHYIVFGVIFSLIVVGGGRLLLWYWSRPISRPQGVSCPDHQMAIYLAIWRYAQNNAQKAPDSLQVLYDQNYINDLQVFCCPRTEHTPGSPDRIDTWTDYIYKPIDAPVDTWLDTVGHPILMDKRLSHHDGAAVCYTTGGASRRVIYERSLHFLRMQYPDFVPEEIRQHYKQHEAECRQIRSVLQVSVKVETTGSGLFTYRPVLTNTGEEAIVFSIKDADVHLGWVDRGSRWGGARDDLYDLRFVLEPGEELGFPATQMQVVDLITDGKISRTISLNKREDGTPHDFNRSELAANNRELSIEWQFLVSVDFRDITDLVLIVSSDPVGLADEDDLFIDVASNPAQ